MVRKSDTKRTSARRGAPMTLLIALGVALVVCGGVGVAYGVPSIRSRLFGAQIKLASVETALTENGVVVEGEDALLGKLTGGEPLQLGRVYDEVLSARNMGVIDQYVRVTVYRYWTRTDKDGVTSTARDLDPSLIKLGFVEGDGWTIDQAASTPERTVLYYDQKLAANGGESSPFANTLAIDASAAKIVGYSNVRFRIEAQVDAVQDHSAERAMTSAWGRTNEG